MYKGSESGQQRLIWELTAVSPQGMSWFCGPPLLCACASMQRAKLCPFILLCFSLVRAVRCDY